MTLLLLEAQWHHRVGILLIAQHNNHHLIIRITSDDSGQAVNPARVHDDRGNLVAFLIPRKR